MWSCEIGEECNFVFDVHETWFVNKYCKCLEFRKMQLNFSPMQRLNQNHRVRWKSAVKWSVSVRSIWWNRKYAKVSTFSWEHFLFDAHNKSRKDVSTLSSRCYAHWSENISRIIDNGNALIKPMDRLVKLGSSLNWSWNMDVSAGN